MVRSNRNLFISAKAKKKINNSIMPAAKRKEIQCNSRSGRRLNVYIDSEVENDELHISDCSNSSNTSCSDIKEQGKVQHKNNCVQRSKRPRRLFQVYKEQEEYHINNTSSGEDEQENKAFINSDVHKRLNKSFTLTHVPKRLKRITQVKARALPLNVTSISKRLPLSETKVHTELYNTRIQTPKINDYMVSSAVPNEIGEEFSRCSFEDVNIKNECDKINNSEMLIPKASSSNFTTPWKKMRQMFATVNTHNLKESRTEQQMFDESILEESMIEEISSECETISNTLPKTQVPTELDMLLSLIQREQQFENANDKIKEKPKRARKGGYVEQFRRDLLKTRMDQRFINHDRRLGINVGTVLRVIDICVSFGVHLAKVQRDDNENIVFGVILPADIIAKVQVGSKLEGFCDCAPFEMSSEYGMGIYVQPHKLILLE